MAVIVVAALRIHTDGNAGGRSNVAGAWNGVGVEWGGNAGVGNLTVGFVPEADIDDVRIYSGRLPIDS